MNVEPDNIYLRLTCNMCGKHVEVSGFNSSIAPVSVATMAEILRSGKLQQMLREQLHQVGWRVRQASEGPFDLCPDCAARLS